MGARERTRRASEPPGAMACKELVMAAAERVRRVLLPEVGPVLAAERANNIAQALLFDASKAEAVAHDMLRDVPTARRRVVAQRVCRAWQDVAEQG